jgi:hypothetical protein
MFSSAELIEALRRRTRRSIRPPPPPGEFPAGWREWFALQAAQPGRVSGAPAPEVIAAAAGRVPVPPPDVVETLGRWRAFAMLWRQEWQPASRDERWTRITAMSGTLLLHVLFVVALVVLMFTRFHFLPAEADARDGEQHVLQVEYIGEGTPTDTGGGAAEGAPDAPDAPAPAVASAPAARVATPVPETVQAPRDVQPDVQPDVEPDAAPDIQPVRVPERELVIDVPEPAPPSVPAPQDVQVTVVDIPDSRFVVPPPRELSVEVPARTVPDVSARRREIDVEAPAAVRVPVAPREVAIDVPQASQSGVAVVEREIRLEERREVPLGPARELPTIRTREAAADAPVARTRDLPMPPARAAPEGSGSEGAARGPASAPTAQATGEGPATSPTVVPPGGRPDAGSGARSAGTAPGAGQQAGQPPGAPPSTRASDDWGDSTRNVPGRQAGTPGASGVFNADGSPRLADTGRVGGGLPPGTITEDFANIDRHGTWLKRPPYDYEPTSFDRFWLPSESLLEEWVRKSVSEVRIPIPGTGKSIRCVTVMLALGGACDILDPNLQEQSAGARKPPDVPFKRELQEDQDSLGPPPAAGR